MFALLFGLAIAETYTVVKGDTLTKIAKRYGTTVAQLCEWNNISNANLIKVGQKLIVSQESESESSSSESSTPSTSTSTETSQYIVQSGDTLSKIAKKFDTTVATLVSMNNIENADVIYVGQVLTVPGSAGSSQTPITPSAPFTGKVTMEQMEQMTWKNLTQDHVDDLNRALETFGITGLQSIRHFISQCAHESDGGRYTKEIASGKAYEGRASLGNTQPGDGPRFKGAGFIQLTGRHNYQKFCDYMGDQRIMEGVDYVAAKYPWTSAGFWWHLNKMNDRCEKGASVEEITKKVNGGTKGLASRTTWYNLACQVFQ